MLRYTGTQRPPQHSYCVLCGSSFGLLEHTLITQALARHLVQQQIGIVCGGLQQGLMGVLADTALEHGGYVIGIVHQESMDQESPHHGVQQLHTVKTLGQRKQLMLQLSQATIALPGGIDTLDEISEVLSTQQLGLSPSPLILINIGGFFDPLLTYLHQMLQSGYLPAQQECLPWVATDLDQISELLSTPSLSSVQDVTAA